MANPIRFFVLNTGAKMPSVGLGTFRAETDLIADLLTTAIKERLIQGTDFVHETLGAYKTLEELWDGEL